MSNAGLKKTTNDVLQIWEKKGKVGGGKKLRFRHQRVTGGQIYRLPVKRFEKIILGIWPAMEERSPGLAMKITRDYGKAVKEKLHIPFLAAIRVQDIGAWEALRRRRADQRKVSGGMLVYVVPNYRALVEKGTKESANWTGKAKELNIILEKYNNEFETSADDRTKLTRDNILGSQVGHAEGEGKDQVGLASSSAAVSQAKLIINEAEARGVPVPELKAAVLKYENAMDLTLDHHQIIDSAGNFSKTYHAVMTEQAAGDNQSLAQKEADNLKIFQEDVALIGNETSTLPADAIAQVVMYNLSTGKFVKSKGTKTKKIDERGRGQNKRTRKEKETYNVITDTGPDVSLYIKKHKQIKKTRSNSPFSYMAMINKRLPQTVRKNMGAPGLVNRTGAFASSVKLQDVNITAQGHPSFGYIYEKNPYQVFEVGTGAAPWATSQRDPRKLIDRSIREVAAELAIGRFYTRRM